ncbi:Transcription termination/antitermination protein NusG [Bienertia sinuspersici]
MNQTILQWNPSSLNSLSPLSLSSSFPIIPKFRPISLISATLNSIEEHQQEDNLPARERRKLRNERRESKAYNWKEEVETRLLKKPKKRYASWTEELNLDNLAHLGPQWWVVRVSRATGQETTERLARSLVNNYPDIDFKLYVPAVQEKRKLKNGSISEKSKPIFPGCVFLKCVMNKEMHDFIRETDGIGGFVGSKVGNTYSSYLKLHNLVVWRTFKDVVGMGDEDGGKGMLLRKRQINKPRPVSEDDIEVIFKQAKEAQEKADLAFQEEHKLVLGSEMPLLDSETGILKTLDARPKRRSKKVADSAPKERKKKIPKVGSTVKVISGSFAEFSGILKKVDKKNGRVIFRLHKTLGSVQY